MQGVVVKYRAFKGTVKKKKKSRRDQCCKCFMNFLSFSIVIQLFTLAILNDQCFYNSDHSKSNLLFCNRKSRKCFTIVHIENESSIVRFYCSTFNETESRIVRFYCNTYMLQGAIEELYVFSILHLMRQKVELYVFMQYIYI